MNIVACVKQVPDTEAQIKVKPDGSGIEEGGIKWVMNPYDEFGVEEALRLKEKNGGEVTIVSVGPQRAMETIRTALAMGADKGIHICDPAFDGADAYVTASALAAAIKAVPFDIVFCGQRAIDDDSAQVGAVLAELLGIPQVTVVTKFEFTDGAVKVIRPIEGAQLLIECPLPCVVTAQKGLNEPRYASLPGIMKAKKKPVEVKDAAVLGVSTEGKAKVARFVPPPARAAGKIICGDGTPEGKAAELAKLLREEAKVI
ncbi:MAG: electron transfer flavoprotein subunit beta [Deltaproteobacteria bacterium RBG_16_58_17]|nr:MAG: electron transfer flavoprotein subunit beta [Deltaproteobacteria bacterium RBG_16_58_17]OHE19046.1 MAG: electron transfer flavoprotein subunit beta [Syntrophobacterales bacterium GWC2_56_13]